MGWCTAKWDYEGAYIILQEFRDLLHAYTVAKHNAKYEIPPSSTAAVNEVLHMRYCLLNYCFAT